MIRNFIFTSESVTEGHPDKLCDQISDAIVDFFLNQDPLARVRAECAVSSAIVFIATRFRSKIKMDFSRIARKVIKRIGYEQEDFNDKICSILTTPNALPVDEKDLFNERELSDKAIGRIAARNQVTVFGFACNHTPTLMPYPIWLAHRLARQLTAVRRVKTLPYLMPDGKVQVGVEFKARQPKRIHSVTVTANQRDFKKPSLRKLRADIREQVVETVFADEPIQPDKRTKIIVNPDGPYFGGPTHHSGLTGRKNAIDTYGEFSRHSGKALSGKDPLRIDRIGAYAARHAAKNVVAAGLAAECEILLSYSIGTTQPVSLQVQTFGTGRIEDKRIARLIQDNFDFRLAAILRDFNLRHLPAMHAGRFYQTLAAYGHFGRTDLELPWEQTDRAAVLQAAAQ
ncbi:MAG: methionine adenosyltransferase [Desulfobacterales bacterium]|jgi:S-adenosylmethionine synthetase